MDRLTVEVKIQLGKCIEYRHKFPLLINLPALEFPSAFFQFDHAGMTDLGVYKKAA